MLFFLFFTELILNEEQAIITDEQSPNFIRIKGNEASKILKRRPIASPKQGNYSKSYSSYSSIYNVENILAEIDRLDMDDGLYEYLGQLNRASLATNGYKLNSKKFNQNNISKSIENSFLLDELNCSFLRKGSNCNKKSDSLRNLCTFSDLSHLNNVFSF
jgi:hypothetical protein